MTSPPDNPAPISLTLVSNTRYLAAARALVSAFASTIGFDEVGCGQITLAIDEALCNVIRHGYEKQDGRPIWLHLWPVLDDEDNAIGLRMVIEDEARQIEPADIRGRDLENVRPGGLGVHIIRELMDEVCYQKRDNLGMRLILVRKLPEAGGRPTSVASDQASDSSGR